MSDKKQIANVSPAPDVTGSLPPGPLAGQPAEAIPAVASPLDKFPAALRNAATAGNPAAQYEIATRYLEGRGTPVALEQGALWLERAAKTGLTPAQFRLGSLYEKGQGVKKNLDTARTLYTAAAEKGNAKAMHNMAVLYAEGLSGKPDYKNAALWFRKAADYGVSDSQYNLGILYARGIGVTQNLGESYKWFALAAAQGDKEATKKRDDVSARMDADTLSSAKAATDAFRPEIQPEEATIVKAPEGGWERQAEDDRSKKRPRAAPMKIGGL
jgi:localization factor PodJL